MIFLLDVNKLLDFIFTFCYNKNIEIDKKRKEVWSMAKIAYVRVSTVEQNEKRQIEALEKHGIDKWYTEKVSAKDTNRPELKAMLDYVREGDTVYIHDFSRLARSTKDLLDIVETLEKKGVALISNKENLDTSTPTGKLMLTVIAGIYEFERANLLERQREGIEIAKREKKFTGRKPVNIDIMSDEFMKLYSKYKRRQLTKIEMAKELNISRPTLDKLIKELQDNINNKGVDN